MHKLLEYFCFSFKIKKAILQDMMLKILSLFSIMTFITYEKHLD